MQFDGQHSKPITSNFNCNFYYGPEMSLINLLLPNPHENCALDEASLVDKRDNKNNQATIKMRDVTCKSPLPPYEGAQEFVIAPGVEDYV